MTTPPLPPELRGGAIRTSTAADYGLTRARLRRAGIQHPYRGVSAGGLDLATVRDRAQALLPVMEAGQVFSHTTALALYGTPLPPLPDDVHVSVAFPRTPPRRPGVIGHALKASPFVLLGVLPVTPAAVAWGQSAALLGREDLVAAGDHLVTGARRGTAGICTQAELTAVAISWSGRPGATRLTWAAPFVRIGARSRPETHLRLLITRARLPEPVVEHPVAVAGGRVLHPDLAYPDARLAVEYEGDGHRSRSEWERDIERRELLADVEWRTIRVTSQHLYGDPVGLVARIRHHLAR
jgi:very-short-patch-repair endonuclease